MKFLKKSIPITALLTVSVILLFQVSTEKITADSELSTVGYKYTVSEYNGKVAIFVYGENTPETILDCRIDALPESEAENLKTGIHVNNDSELQSLIEAYD